MLSRLYLSLFFIFISVMVSAQNITHKGSKSGLNDKEGNVILEPVYDLVKGPVWDDIYIAAKGNKYAYVIRENSFTRHVRSWNWIQSEDYVDSVRWKISAFDFDEIYPLTVKDDRARDENERYIYKGRNCHSFKRKYYILGYSKNNKHGFITIDECVRKIYSEYEPGGNVRSDSVKFSLENTTVHEAKYDAITMHKTESGYSVLNTELITLKGDKVGMFDFAYNVEYVPEYDTLPAFDCVHIYYDKDFHYDFARTYFMIRKNNLWGLVYQQEEKIVPVIDCQCATLKNINKESGQKYYCVDARGSVVLFDVARTKEGTDNRLMFQPLVDGFPISGTSNGFETRVMPTQDIDKTMLIILRDSANADYWGKQGSKELYLAYTNDKTVKAFREPNAVYHVFESKRNSLVRIIKDHDGKKTVEYLDPVTNEVKISFAINATTWVREETYDDPYASNEDDTYLYGVVSIQNRGESEKLMGYYNFNTGKFSKSKPPRYKK